MYTYQRGIGWTTHERTVKMKCGTVVRLEAREPAVGEEVHAVGTLRNDPEHYYRLSDEWYRWFEDKHYAPAPIQQYYIDRIKDYGNADKYFFVVAVPV